MNFPYPYQGYENYSCQLISSVVVAKIYVFSFLFSPCRPFHPNFTLFFSCFQCFSSFFFYIYSIQATHIPDPYFCVWVCGCGGVGVCMWPLTLTSLIPGSEFPFSVDFLCFCCQNLHFFLFLLLFFIFSPYLAFLP